MNAAVSLEEATLIPFPEKDPDPATSKEKPKAPEKEDLFKICAPILTHSNILELFTTDLHKSGVVGEHKICKLLYLALTTRIFDRPVSIAVKGPSSGGKSFLVDKVLGFFPSSAYYMLSSMSSKALVYTDANFKHRFILFAEADGITDQAEYYIRTLLSENCLKHEVTEPDKNGKFHTRLIEKEGPSGLILTTTRTSLNPENETRIISVTVIDTKEQSKEVLMQIAEDSDEELDTSKWMALQEYIAINPPKVRIPYAKKLASLTNADALRMKRDFKAFLNLIKAHALLHAHSRAQNENDEIIATLEDYAQVRDIVGLFISEGVESSVSPTIRETVKVVAQLLAENECENETYCVSLHDIASKLNLDKSAAARRVRSAVEAEYLINLEARSGRPAKVKLGNPLPEEQDVLPTVEKLKE